MVQSKLLLKFKDVKHYFFDRSDSLNPDRLGIKADCCISAEQIHGSRVVLVSNNKHTYIKNCDGMITKETLFLSIHTADCLPIFFYNPKKMIVSAIHAGWRGLFLGIVQNAIKKMKELDSNPGELIAVIGPSIKACCYNVAQSRMEMFQKKQGSLFSSIGKLRQSQWYLDLEKIAKLQMTNLGVLTKHIDALPFCTSCDKRFYSARRDGYLTERMSAIIGLSV